MHKYGLTENECEEIYSIFKSYPEVSEVILFGSRALNTFKKTSDIDFAFKGKNISSVIGSLIDDFEESSLIYTVDVVDYQTISSEKLLEHIQKFGTVFYRRGWREENLVSCLDSVIDYRGKTPKKSESGILTLSAKSVKMGKIEYDKAYYISEETYDKFMVRGFPKKGDILMTTEAPLGCIAKLDRDGVSVAQRLLTLRGKKDILDNDYLMYYLMSIRGQHELQSRASGSTVQGIKKAEFNFVNIVMPSYPEQKAIANVLSSFDEKIELLREQNETLETLAQTLFKEWFVFNDDSNWDTVKLGDFISVKHGFAFKGKSITTEATEHILITPGNFLIGGGFKKGKMKYYDNGSYPDDYIFKTGDLMVTMTDLSKNGDTLGYPALVPHCNTGKYLHNQRIGKVLFESAVSKYFLYFLMRTKKYQRFIVGSASGSTVKHTAPKTICSFEFKIPPEKMLQDFSATAQNVVEKIEANNLHIEELSKIRDTLLPKLLNGSVRVEGFGG